LTSISKGYSLERKPDAPFDACVYRWPDSCVQTDPHRLFFESFSVYGSPGFSGANPIQRHRGRRTPHNPRWQPDVPTKPEAPSGARQKAAPSTPYLATMSGTCNSFCKVLFILRSHYLCAIGLRAIFSLGRDIPAVSRCSPNQHYSSGGWQPHPGRGRNGGFTLLAGLSRELRPRQIVRTAHPNTLQFVNRRADDSAQSCSPLARRYDGNRSCCLFLG
jgi:hypothetical protein